MNSRRLGEASRAPLRTRRTSQLTSQFFEDPDARARISGVGHGWVAGRLRRDLSFYTLLIAHELVSQL